MAPAPILRRDPGHRTRRPAGRPDAIPAPPGDVPRMRVLSILSSAIDPGSPLMAARFELAARLRSRADFTFAVDDAHPATADAVLRLANDYDLAAHVGPGISVADAPDPFSADLAGMLRRDAWDLVETSGAANVATHALVLREIGSRALACTPALAPGWNDGWPTPQAHRALDVLGRTLRRADAVLALSPWEVPVIQANAPGRNHVHLLPLGCRFDAVEPGPAARRPWVAFAGDPTRPADRFGLAVRSFAAMLDARPELGLLVPCPPDARDRVLAQIPEPARAACDLRPVRSIDPGQARAVLALGDFARSGPAVLEALAAGTPVFLGDGDPARSLLGHHPGVAFAPDDPDVLAGLVAGSLGRGADAVGEVLAHRDRLRAAFDWDALAVRYWDVLASAWFTHNYIDHPFRGPVRPEARISARA